MNILSLFDGIGGARLALEKNGVKINNYFSSEIDPFCNQVLNHHYDDIIHLGDIRNIKASDLPEIDLLIGGSPCQDLSIAQKGMGLEGKNSSLFYEFVRILNEVNPKYFLLENVRNNSGKLMSKLVGVDYVEINSRNFSAQQTVHPTQKPIALAEYIVNTYTNEGDVVCDPTMGSGTACLAAKNLSRGYIGIELDEEYYFIAEERLNAT